VYPGNSLTRAYLEQVTVSAEPPCLASELLRTAYGERFLPRPVFLERTERDGLARDLGTLLGLLDSLPERLFGGDVAAMALATGLSPAQAGVVASSGSGRALPLGRADLYRGDDGFRILEFNISSALGGFENAEINRAVLGVGEIAAFVERHGLTFHDTFSTILDTMFAACPDLDPGGEPVVALLDWPADFPALERRLEFMAGLLSESGVVGIPCHAGQVQVSADGSLTVAGRRIDAVYRFVLIEDVINSPAVFQPVLDAVARGSVSMFSSFDSEAFGSKGNLALLQEDRYRDDFTASERAFVARFVPPTHRVRDGTVEWDGERVKLLPYARAHRTELVLKPTSMHGGSGVVCGWTVQDGVWEDALQAATDGAYILQQRVRPVPERIWGTGSDAEAHVLNWGVYLGPHGYAGTIVRASPDPEVGIVSMAGGARVGCCFSPVA
jgi:hypothetical protein